MLLDVVLKQQYASYLLMG